MVQLTHFLITLRVANYYVPFSVVYDMLIKICKQGEEAIVFCVVNSMS